MEVIEKTKELRITEQCRKLLVDVVPSCKDKESKPFTSNPCLKQGDSLSPTLFNIVLEIALRRSRIKLISDSGIPRTTL